MCVLLNANVLLSLFAASFSLPSSTLSFCLKSTASSLKVFSVAFFLLHSFILLYLYVLEVQPHNRQSISTVRGFMLGFSILRFCPGRYLGFVAWDGAAVASCWGLASAV